MNGPMKNIDKAQVLVLRDQVAYQDGQIVSKTLAQNNNVSITLFSFDKGEITIDGEKYILHTGESIVMPKDHPHAVFGKEKFKMLLVVVF